MLKKGTKVYVAPNDLTDDDGFRNEGTITRVLSSTEFGDSDTYYEVTDVEEPGLFSVHEDQVTPIHPADGIDNALTTSWIEAVESVATVLASIGPLELELEEVAELQVIKAFLDESPRVVSVIMQRDGGLFEVTR